MVLKIAAIGGLIACGLLLVPPAPVTAVPGPAARGGLEALFAFGAAMAPVLFAYGGWQTASFVSGELRDPRRDLPRGLLWGVTGVVLLYLGVNWACVRALGGPGLAQTPTPASDVMQRALGPPGARFIEVGIAISTLGFLSQSMLTAPRVYYAMAEDGVFFETVGRVHPRSRVPVVAIALQGAFAMLLTAWGQYRRILNYMIAVDFIFFGLTATCLFVFRRRDREAGPSGGREAHPPGFRAPGHPWTTGLFVAASWLFVLNLVAHRPQDTLLGMAVLFSGLPAYAFWRWRRTARRAAGQRSTPV
jgi:APA family basic amino acid/polyamine antiporter